MNNIEIFVRRAGWAVATAVVVAGDASARRFSRLTRPNGETAILMDAAAEPGSSARFVRVAGWISRHGFSAPRILAQDLTAELLLVEDFGEAIFAPLLAAEPALEQRLYDAMAEFLVAFQRPTPPDGLTRLGGAGLADLATLVLDWYLPGMDAPLTGTALSIPPLIARLYDGLAKDAPLVTSLRDFHAENVFWLPDRAGPARLGLIDFQDAVAAHPLYDLVSFLQDARRDLRPETETAVFARYASLTAQDPAALRPVYALIGAQRALRILGVFARLVRSAGKHRYAAFFPRVWGHLSANLSDPSLTPLAEAVRAAVPEPTPERVQRMIASCHIR